MIVLLLLNLFLSYLMSQWAIKKQVDPYLVFFLSFIFSPIIGGIYILLNKVD